MMRFSHYRGGVSGGATCVLAVLMVWLVVPVAEAQLPPAIYLTWQRDPTTTMTVQWHTDGPSQGAAVMLEGNDGEESRSFPAKSHPMVFSQRHIHTVELIGLEPDTRYTFRLLHIAGANEHSRDLAFRTMPAHARRPIHIALGGDVRHDQQWMEQTNRQAMRFSPDLIVWGGDLAYADGREDRIDRWYEFFDAIRNTLIAEDGRVVPILFGIGNHEVRGGYYDGGDRGRDGYADTDAFRNQIAPYYYSLFAFPGHPGYATLDFGDYMSVILLDSDHSGPVEGKQTDWLAEQLAARINVPHVLPMYHVPAFPSHRAFNSAVSRRVREHWVPLFERFGVRAAFENHEHAYKRTVPIREGAQAADGVTYIGDGAWGVRTRSPRDVDKAWYLAKTQEVRHVIILTINGTDQSYLVISENGDEIDRFTLRPWHPPATPE